MPNSNSGKKSHLEVFHKGEPLERNPCGHVRRERTHARKLQDKKSVSTCGRDIKERCGEKHLVFNRYPRGVHSSGQDWKGMSAHRLHGRYAGKNCYGSLFSRKCCSNQVSSGVASHVAYGRLDIQRVGCGMGWEQSTLRIMGDGTAQTERILMRLVDTSSLDSRLHHSGENSVGALSCVEFVTFLVVSASVSRMIRHSF